MTDKRTMLVVDGSRQGSSTMIQRVAGVAVWAMLVTVVAWAMYDWFIFVVLSFPIAVGMAVGSALMTWLAIRRKWARLFPLFVASVLAAAVASLASVAYFVWWGFAFDAADTAAGVSAVSERLGSVLLGVSAVSITSVVFIAGAAWIIARPWAPDQGRAKDWS